MDLTVTDNGSVIGFTPVTEAGRDFLHSELETEVWQWMGKTLWVDHRMAYPIIDLALSNGLIVGD